MVISHLLTGMILQVGGQVEVGMQPEFRAIELKEVEEKVIEIPTILFHGQSQEILVVVRFTFFFWGGERSVTFWVFRDCDMIQTFHPIHQQVKCDGIFLLVFHHYACGVKALSMYHPLFWEDAQFDQ